MIAALLLALGGLMTFTDIWLALLPPAIMYRLPSGRGERDHAVRSSATG